MKIRKFLAMVYFFVTYIPALLATVLVDGIKGTKYFVCNAHETFKYLCSL